LWHHHKVLHLRKRIMKQQAKQQGEQLAQPA
jgi:hypothetical protein